MAHYIDNVLTFAKPLISGDSKQNSRHFENLIKATAEHGLAALKDPDALNSVVAEINSCLNSSRKRLEGLSALKPVVISCSDQVFSNNCQTWFQLLLQALQSYGSPRQHQLTLQLLTVIIQRVTAFPELDREFGTAKIKTLLPTLLLLCSKSTEEAVSSLHCIMACIKFFPGPTSLFKTKIEAVLVEGLDSASPPQVYTRCYAALARCSTGGHRGDKHRDGWSTLYDKLIATLNYTLAQLYQGFETGEEAAEDEIFQRPIPDTQPEQTTCLVHRFTTLCACIEALLREPSGTWVQIPLDEILRFVCRALAVQMDMLVNKVSADHLLLLTYLPILHMSALDVLSQLIVCAKRLLVPDSDLILRLCIQSLASTHLDKTPSSAHKPFRKLRGRVYETLRRWLEVSGAACGLLVVSDGNRLHDLLIEIFLDIGQQQQEALQLGQSGKNSSGPPAKKKKKKGKKHNYQELSTDPQRAWLTHHHTHTAQAALKVLCEILGCVGATMTHRDVSMIQTHILDLVREVQQNALPPYSSSLVCRQLLYDVMAAAACLPLPDVPFLQSAVSCFQRGSVESDFVVATKCREALALCQSLIHPMVPSLLPPKMHPPIHPSVATLSAYSSSDGTFTTTTTISTHNNNSHVTSSNDSVTNQSSASSRQPEDSQHRQTASDLNNSVQGVSKLKGSSAVLQSDASLSAVPSTSTELGANSNSSPAKRKRGEADSDDKDSSDDDDDDDEEEEERMEKKDGEEMKVTEVEKKSVTVAVEEDLEERDDAEMEDEGRSQQAEQDPGLSAMLESFNPCAADPDISDLSD